MNQVDAPGLLFADETTHRPSVQQEPLRNESKAEDRGPPRTAPRASSMQGGSSSNGSAHIAVKDAPLAAAVDVEKWEFHNKYGVIHGGLCEICQDYIAHLKAFYNHPNYGEPQGGSKGLSEAFHREGAKEGVRFRDTLLEFLQAELIRVEEERKATFEKLVMGQIECTELRDELRLLRTELADLRPTPVPTAIPPKVACNAPAVPSHSIPLGAKTASSGRARAENPKTNPRLEDPVEVWYDYYCTHRKSWPRGVRIDAHQRPTLSDLRADRAVARFCSGIAISGLNAPTLHTPGPDSSPASTPRNQFKNLIVALFSQPGLYAKLLVQMNLGVSPLKTYSTYSGSFPMKMEDMAVFLARSGVTPQIATSDFEPWAKNYREGVNESTPSRVRFRSRFRSRR